MERGRDASLRPTVIRAVVLGVIASIIGIVLGLLINWFPAQGSTQAEKIDTFWDVLIICSVPVFVLVTSVVLISVIKFRMRPGEEELDGPPIHGNTRLEVIWTSVPATLLIALCAYAYIVLHEIEKAPAQGNELHVHVIGQQFTWTFEYTGTSGKKFTTTQLYVPEGKSVRFDVNAKDVLHDFWVPAWRMKIDAVPGITTHYRITPTTTGHRVTYPVVCAELCGLGHAFMRQTAHVLPQQEFVAWMARQSRAGAAAGGGGAAGGTAGGGATAGTAAGKQVFASNGCSSCHTLSDAGASGTIGPNLDKVLASRDAAFIKQSIVDPGAFVEKGFPNGVMPTTYGKDLKPADLAALVKYLSTVTHK
ncbi:MAG TPA: cytochrome c oxidase subunit II [Thermoleophilaceae bacterium]|nr:cytochrome c oxidase subunit II [Thermoleophilaceae bacterium]